MATRMQQRRGTAAQWTAANPVLGAGEIGFETDSGKFKIGDGTSTWANLDYFTTIDEALGDIIDGAPSALNTLNELAAALGDDANYAATITNSLAGKLDVVKKTAAAWAADTTPVAANVIAIATDTQIIKVGDGVLVWNGLPRLATYQADVVNYVSDSLDGLRDELTQDGTFTDATFLGTITLPSTTSIGSVSDTEISYLNGVTASVQGQIDDIVTDVATLDTALDSKANTSNPTFTGTVSLPTSTSIGDVSSDEIGYLNGATSNIQTQINNKADSATVSTTYAPINSPTFTGNVSLPVTTTLGNVSSTEIGYLSNVTSDVQTQLDGKAASSHTHAQSDITNLTTDLAAKANLAGPTFTGTVTLPSTTSVGSVSSTELGYLDGVTSAIQTQINSKAPTASPTFTGTVSGITKSMVGLANVDNTADADKPVSTATQTALNAKLNLSGGTMTGALTLSGAPTDSLHAATKAYVDSVTEGLHIHPAVKAATTTNITLSSAVENGDVLDGVTLATGDRILVKNQTTASQNGIYVVAASGAPTRAADFDTPAEIDSGDFVFVDQGTVNGNTGWVQINVVGTVGTDPVEFTQFSGAGTYLAGTGLTLTGNTFSINTGTTADLSTAQTLTNKTISADNNTISGIAASSFVLSNASGNVDGSAAQKAIPSGVVVGTTDTQTLTNKTIALGSNTVSGTLAEFNAAVTDADLAPVASPTFTGTVTVSASGIAFSDGTQTKEGVPSRTAITQVTAAYNLSTGGLSLRDGLIEVSHTGGSAVAVTIPADSTTNFPIGTSIDVLRTNTGGVSIAGAAGVTVNATPGLNLRAQWSSVTLFKRAANTWVAFGDLAS